MTRVPKRPFQKPLLLALFMLQAGTFGISTPALAHESENSSDRYAPPATRVIELAPQHSGLGALFGKPDVRAVLSSTKIVAQTEIAKPVEEFYTKVPSRLLWVSGDNPTPRARTALTALSNASELGLDPADYEVDMGFEELAPGSVERAEALARFEVSLTASLLTFLEDDYRGRIDPNSLSSYYDFKRKTLDVPKLLASISAGADIAGLVARLTPGGEKFLQLASELRHLRNSPVEPQTSQRIDDVIVAMEGLRWLPDDLGSRYVFINQPAFMAYYHDHDELVLSMKAVIGQEGHQTNFFKGTIQTVEFNPDWIVPQSIIENEMLPKLRRDAGYLDQIGYRLEVGGKPIRSADVNWANQTIDNVKVVQPPGPNNALGQLKILFPNAHAIYMHDTPAKDKFAMSERMFSHGCVRLANPRGMAAAVLGSSVDEVSAAIATGKTTDQPLENPLPVYVTYFTAWPKEDGTVQYFDDVYGRDALTLEAMKTTTEQRRSHSAI